MTAHGWRISRQHRSDGKANAELVALVARNFGCSKASVSIKSGASARTKLIRIEAA